LRVGLESIYYSMSDKMSDRSLRSDDFRSFCVRLSRDNVSRDANSTSSNVDKKFTVEGDVDRHDRRPELRWAKAVSAPSMPSKRQSKKQEYEQLQEV
jgi:hypothetical protein